jgi:hypothetical protein
MWESDLLLAPSSNVTYFGGTNDLIPILTHFVRCSYRHCRFFSSRSFDESSKSPVFLYPQTYPQSAIHNCFVQCSFSYPLFYPRYLHPRCEGRQCSDNNNIGVIFVKSNRKLSGEVWLDRLYCRYPAPLYWTPLFQVGPWS